MEFSVIIPTYNRNDDLEECIASVINQTLIPKEIIVVDNGKKGAARAAVGNFFSESAKKNISLRYLSNEKENSLTVARNIGIDGSRYNTLLFLDDDVVLDGDYLRQIAAVYESNPDAVGVQGYYRIGKISFLGNWLKKIFFLYHYEKNSCRVLRSVSATYPYNLDRVISCQWLSGANHSWRKDVVDIRYDENLKKYSEGEDLDFSYRLYKKYPGKLFITPFARLEHKASPTGRVLGKELAYMNEVYGLYLRYKLFGPDKLGGLLFLWSRAGKIFFSFLDAVRRFSVPNLWEIVLIFRACLFSLRHIGRIKRGELGFFNRRLAGVRKN